MSVHYTLTKHINLTVFLGGRHTYQLVSISHLHCGQGRSSFTTVALKQQVATVATVVAVSFKIIILLYWLDVMMSCEVVYADYVQGLVVRYIASNPRYQEV